MKEKIAFPQLVELVAEKASTTTRMSELFLQELFATVTQVLDKGQSVTIKGLGSFKPGKDNDENTVVFTPDKDLAQAVNAPFEQFKPVELCDEVTQEQLDEIDASMEPEPVAAAIIEPSQAIEPAHEQTTETTLEKRVEAVVEPQQEEKQVEPQPAREEPQQPQHEAIEAPKPSNKKKWLAIAAAIAAIAIVAGITSHYMSKPNATNTNIAENDSIVAAKPAPMVTDTLRVDNLLFDMAKRHYGDKAFWVYIAIENQKQHPDYHKIPIGASLVIPPAEKYGINSDSKQSLRTAMDEAMKLSAQVKAMKKESGKDDKEEKDKKDEKDRHHHHHHHHH